MTDNIKAKGDELDELIVKIIQAIYWKKTTNKENAALLSILKNGELDNFSKAHCICDYLKIERRGNRAAIADVLNNNPITT